MVYAVGKKGRDALERSGYHIAADYSEVMDEPSYHDAMHIGRRVLEALNRVRSVKSTWLIQYSKIR